MIPAFREACRDPEIRGHPLAVLGYLLDRLDVGEFRRLKVIELSRTLRMREDAAARALNALVERGYVERQGTRRDRRYRLYLSRHHSDAAA